MLMPTDGIFDDRSRDPCYRDYINRWRRRFVAQRLDALYAAALRLDADRPDAWDGGAHSGEDAASPPMAARVGARASWDVC
jgi:hypothetical protein